MTNICKALKEDFARLFFREGATHAMRELLRSRNSLDDEWEALIESIEKENEEKALKAKQLSERPKTIVQIDDLDEPEKSSITQIDDVTMTAALTAACSAACAASC